MCIHTLPHSHFGQPACSSQLAPGSPDSASSQSPAAEADASPSHPADTAQPLMQQPQLLQPQSRQNTEAPSPPSSRLSQGTLVPQAFSSPMSIPSRPHAESSSQQSPESSSAPSDLRDHIHCWPQHTSNNQEDSPAAMHQLPQASPSCHFEQGTASHEGHHAVRRSALHHHRSSRRKADGGSGHGHGIRWNDSRESLLSSHDDLAQLVPDRASKGGVEQAPEVASFTGQLCTSLTRRTDLPCTYPPHSALEGLSVSSLPRFGIVIRHHALTADVASLLMPNLALRAQRCQASNLFTLLGSQSKQSTHLVSS